jgi:N-acetylglucosamine-6-phosphate deacetylase
MSTHSDHFALSCARIFDGDQFLADHCLVVRGGQVAAVLPADQRPADLPHEHLAQGLLVPGLVDLQVNGGGDVLLHNSPDAASVHTLVAAHRKLGTTSLMPTLLSADHALRAAAIAAVEAAAATDPGILGIHIEGPWFAPSRHGAHDQARLEMPGPEAVDQLCAIACPAIVTLAPEVGGNTVIEQLAQAGVTVCAGHTEASAEQIHAAQRAGLAGITHLFNAMSPLTSRAPGTVGAALTNDALWASVIADGHHVHPDTLALAVRAKPAGALLLVSDAMATVGGNQQTFDLYGETITVQDGRLVNRQDKLAGSAISLLEAVAYLHREVGVALDECLRMASLYPARVLGRDAEIGRLRPGYRADLLHAGEDLTPLKVWAGGRPCH